MRTASRSPILVPLALLALGFAVVMLVRPAASLGSHDGCALSLSGPFSDYGIYASAYGAVDCATAKNVAQLSLTLTRDGNVVASSDRTCHKATSCWTYVLVNDSSGDQAYCATVSARIGPHSLTPITRCETGEAP